jgi:hypothetical protein
MCATHARARDARSRAAQVYKRTHNEQYIIYDTLAVLNLNAANAAGGHGALAAEPPSAAAAPAWRGSELLLWLGVLGAAGAVVVLGAVQRRLRDGHDRGAHGRTVRPRLARAPHGSDNSDSATAGWSARCVACVPFAADADADIVLQGRRAVSPAQL